MADTRTRAQRSKIMAAVKQKNTTPELELRRLLYERGVRGWRCGYRKAQGRPDLAWPGLRVAIFVDGAFWHGHPSRHKPGRSGRYWDEKIAGNVVRDRRVDDALTESGWEVLRVWDFEIRKEPRRTAERVIELLRNRVRSCDAPQAQWQKDLL